MKETTAFVVLVMTIAGTAASTLTDSMTDSVTDIDYSHDVRGTGTVITDYKIGSERNTEATGKLRGTGEVMNSYLFWSGNGSENVTIEDQFVLSRAPAAPSITLADYPQLPERPRMLRLVGTAWASEIEVFGAEIPAKPKEPSL